MFRMLVSIRMQVFISIGNYLMLMIITIFFLMVIRLRNYIIRRIITIFFLAGSEKAGGEGDAPP